MKIDSSKIFEQLEPPAGGIDRLKIRFNEPVRKKDWMLVPVFALASLVLVAVWNLYEQPETGSIETATESSIYNAPELDRLLGRKSEQLKLNVVLNGQEMSVVELSKPGDMIHIYEIQ